MATRIAFKNARIDRADLVEDLEVSFTDSIDIESVSDEDLQEVWVQHGGHTGTWVWERIHTDDSAPCWDWVAVNEEDDVESIKNEIAALRKMIPDQVFSFDRKKCYLSDLEQGLHAFEQGEKIWMAIDDGIHLGIQDGMSMAQTRGGVSY